ncbi:MAG: cytochrome c biogenesis protein CcsA [Alistipes ihumii]
MAAATLIEARINPTAARAVVYHSWWFGLLLLLLAVNFMLTARRMRLARRRRWGVLLLHYGLAVTLAGAFVAHAWGYEGYMHIREGETSNRMMTTDRSVREVPFEITLNRFTLSRYQGSQSPSSYESDVTIRYKGKERNRKIYMNNIARVGGFRIYQSSYDRDERGTILSVNHDPAGTALTYAGYALLFAGLVASLASRKSRLRTLYRSLGTTVRLLAVAGLLLSAGCSADAGSRTSDDVPDRAIAARFGALPVQSLDGRIEPLGSYASEVLRKLYHGERYRGMNADQVLLGIVTDSARWSREPLIRLDSKPLREALGTNRTHVSFAELFDGVPPDGYRIGKQAEAVYAKAPAERTKLDKEYLKLDERRISYTDCSADERCGFSCPGQRPVAGAGRAIAKYDGDRLARTVELFGRLVRASVSRDDRNRPRARRRPPLPDRISTRAALPPITAELLYNRLSPFRWAMRGYLILGTALLGAALWEIFGKNRRRATRIASIAAAAVAAVFAWQTFGLGLRWYVSGHAPWSNAYETMVYVGWATVLSGLVFARRSRLAPALAALMGGVALFVSNLNWLDPQITPLVPVLKSYWLMIHVSVVTASYGFFGICAACGIASLAATAFGRNLRELRAINEMAMIVGLALLTAGIFFGAVWANESWGRYWGWDPKETWALITMFAYALATHSRHIPRLDGPFAFDVLSVVCFSTVLMTFFGVNYYLSGLHSYGHSGGVSLTVPLIGASVVIALIAAAAGRYFKTSKKR